MTDNDKTELVKARDDLRKALEEYGKYASGSSQDRIIETGEKLKELLWRHRDYIVDRIWSEC